MDFKILECKHFVAPSAKRLITRTVTDYEFDLYLKGDRTIYIDSRRSDIKKGDISFRRPGQSVCSIGDYDCYILTLDFSCEKDNDRYSRNNINTVQRVYNDSIVSELPDKITACSINELATLFEELLEQVDLASVHAKNIVKQILYTVNADNIKARNTAVNTCESAEDIIYKYINENFKNKITLDALAGRVHLDAAYLSRIFKKKFGIPPIEYVIRQRLDYARSLVLNTDMTATQIASYCGYNNVSFFIAAYKKEYGFTPCRHRQALSENI